MKTQAELFSVVTIDAKTAESLKKGAKPQVFVRLSGCPTESWTEIFLQSTIPKPFSEWPKMFVDGDCVIVGCSPNQFNQSLLDGIKLLVRQTDSIYLTSLKMGSENEKIQAREQDAKMKQIKSLNSRLTF